MSKFESLVEDYATEPVPQDKTYGGLRIGFVVGGIGIALPSLLSGAQVGLSLGLERSIYAFVVAGLLVTGMAAVSGWVGMRSRLSTYMIIQFSFGRGGAKLVNLAFAVTQIGWFAVNAYLFGTAAESVGENAMGLGLSSAAYVILGGALMTGATIFGFKALDKMALFAVPVLFVVLALMISLTFGQAPYAELASIAPQGGMTMTRAITALAGGIIVGVVLLPDLTRYARGPKDVIIAVLIALGVVEPLIHTAGAAPALLTGETEPLLLMQALGFGAAALFVLIFTSFTTNAVNLYGAGLALSAVYPRVPEWRYVAIVGVVGSALALFNVHDYFISFLYAQSMIFSAVVGIYVVDFFFIRRSNYDLEELARAPAVSWPAFAAWASGVAVAFFAERGDITLTTAPNFDGALAGAIVYGLLAHFARARIHTGAN
ncbi:MAG: cytosine permease [Parvularculaceae bacterium]